ncbi:Uncharacterized protein APZ42_005244 [Daphnia magna]|uniref:BEN domain-containing protein n=1 Tax=Daphnia magna TaxID=35525 RepID=A0A162D5D0_9CRUS|nr:Uncharacterized protein APZ42_005244 [Daphnia magna]
MNLNEQIEQLKNHHPITITTELQKNFTISIKETIISSIQEAMKSISPAPPSLSPPRTPSPSNSLQDFGSQLVPLGKQQKGSPPPMMINGAALRRAITAGRMGAAQPQVNSCVRELLSGFFSDAQLAKLSLSGRKCPTKQDGEAKEKLPGNIKLSITGN